MNFEHRIARAAIFLLVAMFHSSKSDENFQMDFKGIEGSTVTIDCSEFVNPGSKPEVGFIPELSDCMKFEHEPNIRYSDGEKCELVVTNLRKIDAGKIVMVNFTAILTVRPDCERGYIMAEPHRPLHGDALANLTCTFPKTGNIQWVFESEDKTLNKNFTGPSTISIDNEAGLWSCTSGHVTTEYCASKIDTPMLNEWKCTTSEHQTQNAATLNHRTMIVIICGATAFLIILILISIIIICKMRHRALVSPYASQYDTRPLSVLLSKTEHTEYHDIQAVVADEPYEPMSILNPGNSKEELPDYVNVNDAETSSKQPEVAHLPPTPEEINYGPHTAYLNNDDLYGSVD
uniref:uncharacterized protein isoform X1 n=2 Tax=Myxine glutinosa TaxID=7769 RepID=UPI00358F797C